MDRNPYATLQCPKVNCPIGESLRPKQCSHNTWTSVPFSTQHTHTTSCDSELTHAKVLSQERSHIPLVWLARNIAWINGASNSVLVDPGTVPVTPYNHTIQPLCPSLKHFILFFSFWLYKLIKAPSNKCWTIMVVIRSCVIKTIG